MPGTTSATFSLRITAITFIPPHAIPIRNRALRFAVRASLLIMALALAACTPAPAAPLPNTSVPATLTVQPAVLDTEAAPVDPTQTATVTPEPPAQPSLWAAPEVPDEVLAALGLPGELVSAADEGSANLRIGLGDGRPAAEWVYALAAPFPTIPDEVSFDSLQAFWKSGADPGFPASQLLTSPESRALFTALWGPPSERVREIPAGELLAAAWEAGDAWAILPFEQLAPRWKVIAVDGASPVRKDFDSAAYPLVVRFSAEGDDSLLPAKMVTNRDPQKLTTVMLTGVTALVRGTGALMRLFGNDYPATDIGPWLQEADILHVNNEVPFAPVCPLYPPNNDLVFCSLTQYIELLEYIGTDVVELSGDHFHDWGDEAILYTLELYKERGWPYYGGGANLEEARRALLLEHNGNRIAFLGCNGKPPWYARASETEPGAWHCDMPWVEAEITRLRAEGYIVIMTFQHEEVQTYEAHPKLMADFQPAADAGAAIVSGSQAHQPQAIEFRGDSFIHYGLGNLFFDQIYISDPNAEAFIDRHVVYDGRHISTELLTIQFVDYARARPMTDEERQRLLETIFRVSIWN